MSRQPDYQRVPNEETIEMKDSSRSSVSNGSPRPQGEEAPPSQLKVTGVVVFYLVAAIVMVMVNKWVLNAVKVPLFFLFCQLGIAVILLHLCALFGYMKLPHVNMTVSRGLAPLISCNVLGLAFNTYCLQYVDASFYQIARGLVLPFTVFFSWWLLRTKSSVPTLAAVAVVCVGFMAGVSAENMSTSFIGVALGVASSVTTAVHAIVVKRSLAVVSGTLDLAYYSNLLSALVILPFVLVSGEVFTVLEMVAGEGEEGQFGTFLIGASVTGVFGFLICIAGFLSIKVTSPISHMVSAAVRGVLQTFLGIWCFGDVVGSGRAIGIVFILSGSVYYVYTKSVEQNQPRPEQSPSRAASVSAGATPGAHYAQTFPPAESQQEEKERRF
ncbi:hypothetical protein BCR35DRAFT_307763 [Leucosporidium creatinivorum]|uniref:Sugar phosphate transporter domain-containing protein n=1 Tax=Leucosporidium creatinivorum TaxID=106004 RepID=A0A1Y2EKY8_9BASI|nr:hypothetical protein BCR35DRAFT_307763 [Leucosporidium creatinivorum]